MNLNSTDASNAVEKTLSLPSQPTAIAGNRDEYCFFLLKALAERGIRVPQDIALVGISNSPFCELSNPPLTSVGFDNTTTAIHAVNIVDAIAHGKEPNPKWLIFPPPQLVIRESS